MIIKLDLSGVTKALPGILADAKADVDALKQKVALDIFNDLVATTPVDTGRARDGWQIDDAGNAIEITNNVEYIGVLNDGSSKQAPAGFVEAAVDRHRNK